MAGNRTQVNCLARSYAHHYTTIAKIRWVLPESDWNARKGVWQVTGKLLIGRKMSKTEKIRKGKTVWQLMIRHFNDIYAWKCSLEWKKLYIWWLQWIWLYLLCWDRFVCMGLRLCSYNWKLIDGCLSCERNLALLQPTFSAIRCQPQLAGFEPMQGSSNYFKSGLLLHGYKKCKNDKVKIWL